ncbi:MAG TPA: hypothetical protein VMM81_06170 [Acidimicrobiia bacterium]|nr:hypothetical protein [Acidimicrobiia bacterium]
MPPVPLRSVAATLEVLEPPTVRRLYFWALQVSFIDDRRLAGAAHLGLQWNPHHPASTAVNWSGYGPADAGSTLLRGSDSRLPGSRNDPNTRDFRWEAGRRYRLEVLPVPNADPPAWRGVVTDLDAGEATLVRELEAGGTHLASPMVWSEVFARCEQPSVAVRWSDFEAVADDGGVVRPRRVRVNYQSRADGGCDNTSVIPDELGLLQVTAVQREVPQGAVLALS